MKRNKLKKQKKRRRGQPTDTLEEPNEIISPKASSSAVPATESPAPPKSPPSSSVNPQPSSRPVSPESIYQFFCEHTLASTGLLALLTALAYYPITYADFLQDDLILRESKLVEQGLVGLYKIWFEPSELQIENHYWPVTYTSFWLDHKLWGGFSSLGFHAVNGLLHFLNTLLIWRLMLRLKVPGAFLIAVFFAVHPVHVETVVLVLTRKDLLATMFYLLALSTWLKICTSPSLNLSYYLRTLVFFVASTLSKTVAITLPAAMLVMRWWQSEKDESGLGNLSVRDILLTLPFFVVGFGIAFADISYYRTRETVNLDYSLIEHVHIATQAIWFYIGKLIAPFDLAIIYPFFNVSASSGLGWMALVGLIGILVFFWKRQKQYSRAPLAAVFFFVIALAPVLGFVKFGYMLWSFTADRYQYLASIASTALIVGGAVWATRAWSKRALRRASAAAAMVVLFFMALSIKQANVYQDEYSYYTHIRAKNHTARNVHYDLGRVLLNFVIANDFNGEKIKDDAQRIELLNSSLNASLVAIKHRPELAHSYNHAGGALILLGRLDEAEKYLRQAIELNPNHKEARRNLDVLLDRRKQAQQTQ